MNFALFYKNKQRYYFTLVLHYSKETNELNNPGKKKKITIS